MHDTKSRLTPMTSVCYCGRRNEGPMIVHIGRRNFLSALVGAAVTWPVEVWPQASAKERPLVAWLSGSASKVAALFADDLLVGMRDFG
jgi:hypothetical protein